MKKEKTESTSNKKNRFRIIIASYNNEDWAEYNIVSILNQTYDNYHVTYVDDCSTDNTYEIVHNLVKDNDKFAIIKNEKNIGADGEAILNYTRFFDSLEDDDIFVDISGDDWLFDESVLENLNNFYNDKDLWMSYGGFYAYNGSDSLTIANPQNTEYPEFITKHKLYRRDVWRAGHLRTMKGFLLKAMDIKDIVSKIDNRPFYHAPDLAVSFPCLEMCPPEKIGVVDFPTYVWNASDKCQVRTHKRETADNMKYEVEIRNRKKYKEGLSGEKLPQVNVFPVDYYLEYLDIPKKFSYCYGQLIGEYDMVLLADWAILEYIEGKISIDKKVPIIARLFEQKDYFERKIYNAVLENYDKFDVVLTFDKDLLQKIPNARFIPPFLITEFNRLPNPGNHPPLKSSLLDTYELPKDALKIYDKTKLVSCVASRKAFLPGHIKRLNFIESIKNRVDLFGRGIREIPSKLDALRDYMFSVAIENVSCDDYYFTEKITECFLAGTIPIYHGCPNIGKFFDERGILYFNNEEELHDIINSLSKEKYDSMLEYAKINFQKCFDFPIFSDDLYDKYYKKIIEDGTTI